MLPFILAGIGGWLIGDSLKSKKVFAEGGAVEYVDLFEYPEQMPEKVAEIYHKYQDEFMGDMDYSDTQNMLNEMEAVGYTFDYYLDNEPYGLRPVGVELSQLKGWEDSDDDGEAFAKGGQVKVGDTITSTTGVKVKVVEYDPLFGGRVKVERTDEYATGKPSQFISLKRFVYENGGAVEGVVSIYDNMSEKDFLKKYWGANVFIGNPDKFFDIKKMSSSSDSKIEKFIEDLKRDGYTIKKKSYSDFTSVMGVKKKMENGGKVTKVTKVTKSVAEQMVNGKSLSGVDAEKLKGLYPKNVYNYFIKNDISDEYHVTYSTHNGGEITLVTNDGIFEISASEKEFDIFEKDGVF